MNLGKGEWALGRRAERYESLWQSLSGCGVGSSSQLLWKEPIPPGWRDSRGEDLWRLSSFRRICLLANRDMRESLFLHALLFKCLQFKVINLPRQHILGWGVLDSCSHIWGGTVCCPSALNQLWNLQQVTSLPRALFLPLQNQVALSCWMGEVL